MRDAYGIALLIAVVIIVGLVLRFGRSSIGLTNAFGSFVVNETNALALSGTPGYFGP